MTTIFDVYNFINFVCDKNRRGFLSPEEVSSALDAGQTDLFHYYWGLPSTAQALKSDAPMPDYGSSQTTLDALRPFRKKQDISPTVLSPTSYLDLTTVVPDYAYLLVLEMETKLQGFCIVLVVKLLVVLILGLLK